MSKNHLSLTMLCALLLTALTAAACAQPGPGGGDIDPLIPPVELPGDSPPEPAPKNEFYSASIPAPPKEAPSGETFTIKVDFKVKEGVHIYKDSGDYSLKFFPGEDMSGAEFIKIIYPPAKKQEDDFEPGKYKEVFEGDFSIQLEFRSTAEKGKPINIRGKLHYQGCDDLSCGLAMQDPISLDMTTVEGSAEKQEWLDSLGLIPLIVFCFWVGLMLSFSPCVYPLVPITVGIVKSFSKPTKKSAFFSTLIYAFGLTLVYATVGTISAIAGQAVGGILKSPPVLILIAAIMVALSLSMFGLFELKLPNRFTNKIQQAGAKTKQNKIGLLVMGMLSGCIAGPCVSGPLAMVIITLAKRGDALIGFVAMSAVAWGMSALLILAGTFNAALPKAGEWMRKVNFSFGFLLLIMAGYFLKTIIGEPAFYLSTGLLVLAWTVFVGCWDALTRESGIAARAFRLAGIIAAVGGLMLTLNGFITLTEFKPLGEQKELRELMLDVKSIKINQSRGGGIDLKKLEESQFPEGGEKEVAAALKTGKPVIIDFYDIPCPYCEMYEKQIFSNPEVIAEMERFETVKVKVSDNGPYCNTFDPNISGPPVIVIYGSDGKIEERLAGKPGSVKDFLKILRSIK